MSGWIKWYRQAELNRVINDGEEPFDKFHAFVWLVENANTKTIKGNYATVKRGQLFTSVRRLAREWRWSRNRVIRFLDELEANGMVTRKSDTKKTVLTIEKYTKYQGGADTNDTTNRTTNGATNGTHNKKKEEKAIQTALKSASDGKKSEYVRPPVEEW